ncbi:hypothetical protein RvY_16500 [Ramazzottius varieornatus]|uniref:HTH psq-type domain-containing protein n=1 Tax=Ramazzottius varieornatus TaxID=947166 RepID=A0A1D1VZI2_RAMVA|nr:hypothetical protein RvY_16500 [Ramazzottius varieornatus]
MPQPFKTKRHRQYTEEALKNALSAVEDGMGLREAACWIMEPSLELIHVVSPPLGFSQRNLVHRFANHRFLGTKTASAIVARNGTGLTAQELSSSSWPVSGESPVLGRELSSLLDEDQLGGW